MGRRMAVEGGVGGGGCRWRRMSVEEDVSGRRRMARWCSTGSRTMPAGGMASARSSRSRWRDHEAEPRPLAVCLTKYCAQPGAATLYQSGLLQTPMPTHADVVLGCASV